MILKIMKKNKPFVAGTLLALLSIVVLEIASFIPTLSRVEALHQSAYLFPDLTIPMRVAIYNYQTSYFSVSPGLSVLAGVYIVWAALLAYGFSKKYKKVNENKKDRKNFMISYIASFVFLGSGIGMVMQIVLFSLLVIYAGGA
jgi:hypothetical protein